MKVIRLRRSAAPATRRVPHLQLLQLAPASSLQRPGVGELLPAVKIPLAVFLVLRAVPTGTSEGAERVGNDMGDSAGREC